MILTVIKNELKNIGVPYEYMRWTAPVNGAYFIGELTETPTLTEDGAKESTLLLTGTVKSTWSELERYRAKIEEHFPSVFGLRTSTETGSIAIFYDNAFPVPTAEADLKRMQINLRIKEWKGMN